MKTIILFFAASAILCSCKANKNVRKHYVSVECYKFKAYQ